MDKERLAAFSDGVIAIIITIMVLELKTPHGTDLAALRPVARTLMCYVLSFIFIGIYWSNHHHLFHVVRHVDGAILWANLHLLFWLSLTPFVMGWLAESGLRTWPVAMYGVVLIMSGIGYYILVRALLRRHGPESRLAAAIGHDFKGKISVVIYASAIALAFWRPLFSAALYVLVAIMWLVPDRRIERVLAREER
ncbi:MAG: TMEM175 family protein [Candidatus Eisenbacteria bacterium]